MTMHLSLLSDERMHTLTPEGARHIETLHLNRPPLVECRKMRRLVQSLLEKYAQRLERKNGVDRENLKKNQKMRRKKKRLP